MKQLISILILCLVGLHISAQDPDSVLLQELKQEVSMLRKQNKSLKYQVNSIKKQHQEDLEKLKMAMDENAMNTEDLKGKLDIYNDALAKHQQASDERFGTIESWSKKMVTILFILSGVLFIVLLILVLINRSAVNKSFIKLDAKVDNVKNEHELAHKELENKYMEELEKLRNEISKK